MALKFLNKKGWHTGSLRNIENVWKAEQKHDAEQKKLEELRKQIHEEREKSEFRQLQVQAGLVPRQERLDFLYESGLAVGKSSDGFKALEAPAESAVGTAPAEASSSKAAVPGALFEDKPQSSNDTWRKLHSDPLLLIRQREQEALARIKNNPIQMSMIRKSVVAEKNRSQDETGKQEKKKHKSKRPHKVKNEKDSDSENTSQSEDDRRKIKHSRRKQISKESSDEEEERRKSDRLASDRHNVRDSQHAKRSSKISSNSRYPSESEEDMRNHSKKKHSYEDKEKRSDRLASDSHNGRDSQHEKRSSRIRLDPGYRRESESQDDERNHSKRKHSSKDRSEDEEERRDSVRRQGRHAEHQNHSPRIRPDSTYEERRKHVPSSSEKSKEVRKQNQQGPGYNRHPKGVPKMTEEEREARLREMQMDAEAHEEQRWKRIKNATEADAREAARARSSGGKNFLDAAQKSIFGTEKGGSSTIEESVRRRAYYSQGGSAAHESNAFRR